MALQGEGVYRINSIYDPTRCIDLDRDSGECFKQTQNDSGRQFWILQPSPDDTWEIRFAGNTGAYLCPRNDGDSHNVLDTTHIVLVVREGEFQSGVPAYRWHIQEPRPGQYIIANVGPKSPPGFAIDYWSDDGNGGPIHVQWLNGALQQCWDLQWVGPRTDK